MTNFYATGILSLFLLSTAQGSPGDLDPTFGDNGRVFFDLGDDSSLSPGDMLLQTDGKIVISGATPGLQSEAIRHLLIARFNSDGSRDTSFNRIGYKLMGLNLGTLVGGPIAQQPDGKLIVTASVEVAPNDHDAVVLRLLNDGSIDTSFGTQGAVTVAFGSGIDIVFRAAIQPDGHIVLAGTANSGTGSDFAVARLTPSGAVDTSFGSQGVRVIDSSLATTDILNGLVLQADGKIVLAGAAGERPMSQPFFVRVDPTGAIDSTFGSGGRVLLAVGAGMSGGFVTDLVLQDDGKLLGIGYGYISSVPRAAAFRLTSDGAIDEPFNLFGPGVPSGAVPMDVMAEANGAFAITGSNAYVARFASFDALDTTFTPTGVSFIDGGYPGEEAILSFASRLVRQKDGRRIALCAYGHTQSAGDGPNRRLMLARLGPLDGGSPGTIGFVPSPIPRLVTEGVSAGWSVRRNGGATGPVSATYTIVPGTAMPGSDFDAPMSGTLSWADGETGFKTLSIAPSNDGEFEPDEDFEIVLSNLTGGATAASDRKKALIRDAGSTASTPTITLARGEMRRLEDNAQFSTELNVEWLRSANAIGSASVRYEVIGETAVDGVDFVAANGTLDLSGTSGSIAVTIPIDEIDEPRKTLIVRLVDPVDIQILQSETAITLVDNDPQPHIEMFETARSVSEGTPAVTLTVTRTAHAAGDLSVDYVIEADSAAAADFAAASGTLHWTRDDRAPKTITIQLADDMEVESDESFAVVLSNATPGTTLGHVRTIVTIIDNDNDATPPEPAEPTPPSPQPEPAPPPATGGDGGGGVFDLWSLLFALLFAQLYRATSGTRDGECTRTSS